MWVDADPAKDPAPLWSKRAADVLTVLEAGAGAPGEALGLLFPSVGEGLRILRGTGYVRRCYLPGFEPLWVPYGAPLPTVAGYPCRVALGWAVCRAVECGCRVSVGHVRFPGGEVFRVACHPGAIGPGNVLVVSVNGEKPPGVGGLFTTLARLRTCRLPEALAGNPSGPG